MKQIEYKISSNLVQIIENSKEQKNLLIEYIIQQFDEYLIKWNEAKDFGISNKYIVKAFYRIIDEIWDKHPNKESISCKKGCSFCCHINVDIFPEEAEIILDEIGMIDKEQIEHLKEQIGLDVMERPLIKNSACVFLKSGQCSIYDVRPINCRKFFVINNPLECDATKSENHFIQVQCILDMEIIHCFLASVLGNQIGMSEAFLNLKSN